MKDRIDEEAPGPAQTKKNGQNRIRTLDFQLEPQLVAELCPPTCPQTLQDPDLTHVVTMWPDLSLNIKAAILALVKYNT